MITTFNVCEQLASYISLFKGLTYIFFVEISYPKLSGLLCMTVVLKKKISNKKKQKKTRAPEPSMNSQRFVTTRLIEKQ